MPPERHGKSQAHNRKLNGAERRLASLLSSRRSAVEVLRLPFLAFHPQITPHSPFIIAHRLATVRHVDRIIVIAGGRVVGSGTHDELQTIENGVYRRLATLQFRECG